MKTIFPSLLRTALAAALSGCVSLGPKPLRADQVDYAADFDSKYAFTVIEDVMALAEATDTTKAAIVTIPAN
jgi:hypothetical protein